ncbi:hypothetical protein H2O64_17510 [Kordia sp. YSTF-M3]|uniref:Uncharacterized protein n=1 Tax=Kordia aestuariivivens TaxID=2759037 RepID=A0ABR7QD28_9FLAO|nr:hypothetical protein [Kordia aestuariivivens]MBC8756475.1 hypothetical protein [Kordia aestuariivivens]
MGLSLKESLELHMEMGANSNWVQTTSIQEAVTLGRSILNYKGVLPLNGTNKGYFVRIIDGEGKTVEGTYKSYNVKSSPVEGQIKSNYLDFYSNNYTLEFGPHYLDSNVLSVAATATIIQGQAKRFQSSRIFKISNRTNSVSYDFSVPPSIFDNKTNVKIYLVAGTEIKGESAAVQGKVVSVSRESYTGFGDLTFDKPLNHNEKYTLCMGIYSSVRQIASNTFIWE